MRPRTVAAGVAASLFLVGGAEAASQREPMAPVPFVGCPSDGQVGPMPAPGPGRKRPVAPRSIAGKLAYYRSKDLGVLGPRGWHCLEAYGSNGAFLMVAPQPVNLRAAITGPGLQLTLSYGGTSGRFVVARAVMAYFPAEKGYVDWWSKGGGLGQKDLTGGVHPSDRIVSVGPREIRFHTPGHSQGLGTSNRLAPGDLGIDGFLKLRGDFAHDGPCIDLLQLAMRLPPGMAGLAPAIAGAAENTKP